jgi:hypothetical protein
VGNSVRHFHRFPAQVFPLVWPFSIPSAPTDERRAVKAIESKIIRLSNRLIRALEYWERTQVNVCFPIAKVAVRPDAPIYKLGGTEVSSDVPLSD